MKKSTSALVLIFLSLLFVVGCGSSDGKSTQVIPADATAANDPNGKGQALLTEFFSMPEADRQEWARNKGFDWSVFDNVSDSQLKAQFDQYVKPLL